MDSRTDASNQYSGGTIPSLDGIRALSVGLVFFAHVGFGALIPGGLGVTIFFVLSGYLITTLMRTEFARRGSIDFPAFYLRRFLRLMPPLFVTTLLSLSIVRPLPVGMPYSWTGLCSVLFYFSNYYRIFAADGTDQPPGMGVTWSLAVEEHYYLLFPPLALALLRFKSQRKSAALLVGLCAVILLWRCALAAHGASQDYLEMATDTRVDAILIGCLMAMVRNPWLDPRPASGTTRDLGVAAVCVAVLALTLVLRDPFLRMTLRYTVQSLAIAVLMYLAVARAQQWPFRLLNLPPITYIGRISYTIYLSHFLVLMIVAKYAANLGTLGVTLLAAGVIIAIAAAMNEWVEKPCHELRRRLHERLFTRRPAPPAVSGGHAPGA